MQFAHHPLLFALNRSKFTQQHVLASEASARQSDAD
jgi:hypothetical protein